MPTIYYGGQSWRAIGYSPRLGRMIGMREIAGSHIIESWDAEVSTHARTVLPQSKELAGHGEHAVLSLFCNLIGGLQ